MKLAHMVLSVDAEKTVDKTKHIFKIKTLSKLGIEENFLSLIENIHKNL